MPYSGGELAAACDLRIAGNSARIGIPIGRFGHCPDRVNLRRMLRLISPAHVKAMIMTDTIYDADDAYRIGFFNWVAPDSALEAFTYSIASMIGCRGIRGKRLVLRVEGRSGKTVVSRGLHERAKVSAEAMAAGR